VDDRIGGAAIVSLTLMVTDMVTRANAINIYGGKFRDYVRKERAKIKIIHLSILLSKYIFLVL
jgi:hypothetical protein